LEFIINLFNFYFCLVINFNDFISKNFNFILDINNNFSYFNFTSIIIMDFNYFNNFKFKLDFFNFGQVNTQKQLANFMELFLIY